MPWAIPEPTGLGKFFPNGSFNEWREAMAVRFETELTDSQREFHSNSVNSYRSSIMSSLNHHFGVEPCELPRLYTMIDGPKPAGDFIIVENGLFVVSDAFRSIVEAFEPSVHHFWPIAFETSRKKPIDVTYFGMVVGNRITSFDPEKTNPEAFRKVRELYSIDRPYTVGKLRGIALDPAQIGGAHLWMEEKLWSPILFVSDALGEALQQSGLKIKTICATKKYVIH